MIRGQVHSPSSWLVLAIVLLLQLPAHAVSQTIVVQPINLPGAQLAPSDLVPAGELWGRLADASTGTRIPNGLVTIEGTGRSALTDSAGWFMIRGIPPGDHTVEAAAIGYQPTAVGMSAEQMDRGWVARFALTHAQMAHHCGLTSSQLAVLVRDVVTGHAPRGQVEVRVGQDSVSTVVTGRAMTDERWVRILLPLQSVVPGVDRVAYARLALDVTAPGYAMWSRDDVWVRFDDCGVPSPAGDIFVWLLPKDSAGPKDPAESRE